MRRLNIAILTSVFLAASVVVAAETDKTEKPKPKTDPPSKQESKQESKAKPEEDEVPTFTTLDFERKYGPSTKPLPKTEARQGGSETRTGDALEAQRVKRDADRDRAAERAKANQRVQQIQVKIANLEKRLALLRNPLLGRAQPGEEDAEAWKNADQGQRRTLTEQQLAAAREELAQAQKELNATR